jgi:tRNA(fMet)-specific endonuclease VapC
MTRVILDTSAYSAFMRGHPGVKRILQQVDEIYLNPVILGELFSGFFRGKHRRKNEAELERFRSSPRVRMLDLDEETAVRYAVILNSLRDAGTPIPTNDIWISASAMQHGLRIVTADTHYDKVAQVLVDFLGFSGDSM